MFTSLSQWLCTPVIEDAGVDRPFRLRRVSLLLMAGGWLLVLVSCLIGLWLAGLKVPVIGWYDLIRGVESTLLDGVQWTKVACEAVGGAMFFAGMFSVSIFDKRDRIPVFRAE